MHALSLSLSLSFLSLFLYLFLSTPLCISLSPLLSLHPPSLSSEISSKMAHAQERLALAEDAAMLSLKNEEVLTETLRLHRKRITKQYDRIDTLEREAAAANGMAEELQKALRVADETNRELLRRVASADDLLR